MKKGITILYLFILLALLPNISFSQNAGIFQTYIVINNGASDSWYAGGINSDGAASFNGQNLGSFSNSSTLLIKGGEIKTYKNNGGDVTGAYLYYRVYKQGNSPGLFNELSLPFAENLSTPGDQKWQKIDYDVNLLSSVNETGNWVIEVFWKITTNIEDMYDSNLGANYTATFYADGSLPVELTSFSAALAEESVELVWQTATEVNNFGFEIERKAEAGDWLQIDFVQGHGNSNSPKTYSYTDNSVTAGKYNYRLKQIDIDGSFEYSDVVEVSVSVPNKLELTQNYPNPFNPATSIQFSLPEAGNVSLSVYNMIGEQVAELLNKNLDAGHHNINFDGSKFNSGVYIYRLNTEKATLTRKMLLMK